MAKNFISRFTRAFNIATDWRYSDKTITLADKQFSKSEKISVIAKLNLLSQQLTQKDIKQWRMANQAAIDIDNPKRTLLYMIYDDAMHDLHLKGAIRNRKMSILGRRWVVKDKDGNINEDLTRLLHMRWFKQFLNHACDAIFYGHSLVELSDIDRSGGKLRFRNVILIPRHHVCPEYGVLLKHYGDWPDKGIPYREGTIADTVIEICKDAYDLGELNSVSKETISKKYVLQFWDQFAEIFGMPVRVGKTTSRDPKDHKKVENMLEQMGAAAWGLFPDGTTIEIIGSKQGDAFGVYDKRIERANSEMSKAILGQTMTMDDGSSKSQAEVHETVSEEIADMDLDFIRDIINDNLLPFLIKHGWPIPADHTVEPDETHVFTPAEMREIETMLLNHFDIDPGYFIDKYGVKILGAKQPVQIIPEEDEEQEEEEEGKKPTEKKKPVKMSLPDWVISMPGK